MATKNVTFTEEATFTVIVCDCGVKYGLDVDYIKMLRKNGKTFYCPNGCSRWYGESEEERLKKQLTQEAKKRESLECRVMEWRDEAERKTRQLSAKKGQITKMKNQAAKGLCLCCGQHFPDLEQHMQTEHPDFESHEEVDADEVPMTERQAAMNEAGAMVDGESQNG